MLATSTSRVTVSSQGTHHPPPSPARRQPSSPPPRFHEGLCVHPGIRDRAGRRLGELRKLMDQPRHGRGQRRSDHQHQQQRDRCRRHSPGQSPPSGERSMLGPAHDRIERIGEQRRETNEHDEVAERPGDGHQHEHRDRQHALSHSSPTIASTAADVIALEFASSRGRPWLRFEPEPGAHDPPSWGNAVNHPPAVRARVPTASSTEEPHR